MRSPVIFFDKKDIIAWIPRDVKVFEENIS